MQAYEIIIRRVIKGQPWPILWAGKLCCSSFAAARIERDKLLADYGNGLDLASSLRRA